MNQSFWKYIHCLHDIVLNSLYVKKQLLLTMLLVN